MCLRNLFRRSYREGGELHMNKKKIMVGLLFAVMSSLMVAGPASAAHCEDPDPAIASPGFSFFGQGGKELADNVEPGANECPNGPAGDPSLRAPGQNK
jgi:hypothetical protein